MSRARQASGRASLPWQAWARGPLARDWSRSPAAEAGATDRTAQRLTTETKSFFKTSEFWAYVAMVVAIVIAGNSIEGEGGGRDLFAAEKVWPYVTLLTVGYMISGGIAKSAIPTGPNAATATPTSSERSSARAGGGTSAS